jgi:hypothetical protein
MSSQNLSDRQARWAAYLLSFHFVIRHVSGKKKLADPLTCPLDFVPAGEEAEVRPRLLLEEKGDLRLRSLSLDVDNGLLDIGEVAVDSGNPPSAPFVMTDVDFVFCPPSQEVLLLLKAGYTDKPPDLMEVDDLEL